MMKLGLKLFGLVSNMSSPLWDQPGSDDTTGPPDDSWRTPSRYDGIHPGVDDHSTRADARWGWQPPKTTPWECEDNATDESKEMLSVEIESTRPTHLRWRLRPGFVSYELEPPHDSTACPEMELRPGVEGPTLHIRVDDALPEGHYERRLVDPRNRGEVGRIELNVGPATVEEPLQETELLDATGAIDSSD